jgi:hypothetical protein
MQYYTYEPDHAPAHGAHLTYEPHEEQAPLPNPHDWSSREADLQEKSPAHLSSEQQQQQHQLEQQHQRKNAGNWLSNFFAGEARRGDSRGTASQSASRETPPPPPTIPESSRTMSQDDPSLMVPPSDLDTVPRRSCKLELASRCQLSSNALVWDSTGERDAEAY